MTLKVKIDDGGFEPVRAYETDAGLDLKSPIDIWVHPGEHVKIDTKIRLAIPEGYFGQITSKSGLMDIDITTEGTIDSHYRGTLSAVLFNHGKEGYLVHKGDKVCQLVITKCETPILEYVEELDETDRGCNGFGSSGR